MHSIHQTVMNNLLLKSTHCDGYGKIYYLAWLLADEEYKHKLEDFCIQDIMYRWVDGFFFSSSCSMLLLPVLGLVRMVKLLRQHDI